MYTLCCASEQIILGVRGLHLDGILCSLGVLVSRDHADSKGLLIRTESRIAFSNEATR